MKENEWVQKNHHTSCKCERAKCSPLASHRACKNNDEHHDRRAHHRRATTDHQRKQYHCTDTHTHAKKKWEDHECACRTTCNDGDVVPREYDNVRHSYVTKFLQQFTAERLLLPEEDATRERCFWFRNCTKHIFKKPCSHGKQFFI